MDEAIRAHWAAIHSRDAATQGEAFHALLEITETPVDWADEVWDDLVADLRSKDNRLRSIASQLLCNLAATNPDLRIMDDFDALLNVTRDERFVTARHCLLALWKIGTGGEAQCRRVVTGLAGRFADCAAEKNATLIRYDIAEGLRKLYDRTGDASIREMALALIGTEPVPKYRKKYAGAWKETKATAKRAT